MVAVEFLFYLTTGYQYENQGKMTISKYSIRMLPTIDFLYTIARPYHSITRAAGVAMNLHISDK